MSSVIELIVRTHYNKLVAVYVDGTAKLPEIKLAIWERTKTNRGYSLDDYLLTVDIQPLKKDPNKMIKEYMQGGNSISLTEYMSFSRMRRISDGPCPICFKQVFDADYITIPCQHSYCRSCFIDWMSRNNTCPTCRTLITQDVLTTLAIYTLI